MPYIRLRPSDLKALPYVTFIATILFLMVIDDRTARIVYGTFGLVVGLVGLIGVAVMNHYHVTNHDDK
ncbi:hypothetical protein [Weissella cibaria]|uniref:hypothetical protein n=1 Tax=Weissella cibaria TaxID=137591 RepID=UPI0002191DD4|nr:hypothetical protein [Weissella cibaria]APS28079.1 hypothetical protein AUC63_02095 [Weissella cibaria]APU63478.1 hypothetical protein AUC65_01702 [Weissella cibaria]APU65628.1 hypothetical protein AUC62_01694 [Weissella cibaria]ASS53096.1 hypothetical protein CHR48_02221 [Weissella cibaria]MBA5962155.1 hypothetical protein [Weissella cibaria]